MVEHHAIKDWEAAYLAQSHDAAVGRLFRGLIHNLSGALQVFSLQSDLFAMSLSQADSLLQRLLALGPRGETGEIAAQLREVLRGRVDAVAQMQEKMRTSEEIIRRTLLLPDFQQLAVGESHTINKVVRSELEFLCADSFFKHTVKKDLRLAEDSPGLERFHVEIHQIVFALLENAVTAMRGSESPCLTVRTRRLDSGAEIEINDSGAGIAESDLPHIFEPFFSTWENHPGLGLYLARQLLNRCGGAIEAASAPGATSFRVRLPGQVLSSASAAG